MILGLVPTELPICNSQPSISLTVQGIQFQPTNESAEDRGDGNEQCVVRLAGRQDLFGFVRILASCHEFMLINPDRNPAQLRTSHIKIIVAENLCSKF